MVATKDIRRGRRKARIHARRRAMERLDLKLNANARAELLASLANGRGRFIRTGHVTSREVWQTTFRGRSVRVVVDVYLDEIVTVF